MIISLIEMLELLNFYLMTTSTIQFESGDKNLVSQVMPWTELLF